MKPINMRIIKLFLFFFSIGLIQAQPTELITIQENERNHDKALDVIFLAEGFTESEQDLFISKVHESVDFFIQQDPFYRFADHINFYAIKTISASSGFNGYYRSSLNGRSILIGHGKVNNAVRTFMPGADEPIVLINSTRRAGSASLGVAISTINHTMKEIVLHEFGHSFGNLADEYVEERKCRKSYTINARNITNTTIKELIPWHKWIEEGTPLPTPSTNDYNNTVGAFEGAAYCRKGQYRPQRRSMMRDTAHPFSKVSREFLIQELWDVTGGAMASYAPSNQTLPLSTNESKNFSAAASFPGVFQVRWYRNVTQDTTVQNNYTLHTSDLDPGTHILTAEVFNDNLVKMATEKKSWLLHVGHQQDFRRGNDFDEASPGVTGSFSSSYGMSNGDFMRFKDVEFGSAGNPSTSLILSLVKYTHTPLNAAVEIRLGTQTGTKIGEYNMFKAFQFGDPGNSDTPYKADITPTSGTHDLVLVFKGDDVYNYASFRWFFLSEDDAPAHQLALSTNALNFTAASGSNTVNVTSNGHWTVSGNRDWLSVSPGEGANNGAFTVTASANTGEARNGRVTVSGGGITQTVVISQAAGAVSYPDKIASISVPNEVVPGETYTISVDYSSSTQRDVVAVFELGRSPWTKYHVNAGRVPVTVGEGTLNIPVTIKPATPLGTNEYKWQIYITETGAGWSLKKSNKERTGIDVIAPQSTHDAVLHWPFNESTGTQVSDASGNGNDGTAFNMTPADWVPGNSGNALAFDGVNDYVMASPLSNDLAGDLTVSAWINTVHDGTSVFDIASSDREGLRLNLHAGGFAKMEGYGTGGAVIGSTPIADNQWHRVVMTREGSTYKLYIDGVLEATQVGFVTAYSRTIVGARATRSGFSNYFSGLIDDFSLVDRALSDGEIRNLYSADGARRFQANAKKVKAKDLLKTRPITIFPNPVKDQLTIRGLEPNLTARIIAYDMTGMELQSHLVNTGHDEVHLSTSQWNAGVYLLVIEQESGQSTHRIIK